MGKRYIKSVVGDYDYLLNPKIRILIFRFQQKALKRSRQEFLNELFNLGMSQEEISMATGMPLSEMNNILDVNQTLWNATSIIKGKINRIRSKPTSLYITISSKISLDTPEDDIIEGIINQVKGDSKVEKRTSIMIYSYKYRISHKATVKLNALIEELIANKHEEYSSKKPSMPSIHVVHTEDERKY